ncbi:acylphosphatase [Methanolobus sediminis]|uniref:Acylphosphatase n=1 Tax=Methanolobus sediminis TaxID=3072978 RepID=A0AA51UIU7_9EURY|nr:acylphosphatase [Methanolobus sediminis]WMW24294.1 acylphosphatase [Methanolobus sediminis]
MSDETNSENLSAATILVKLRSPKGDFHEYASKIASQRSLKGYSQDISDGLYKVVVEGEKSSIQALIGYMEMNKTFDKSDTVAVDDVIVSWSSYSSTYSDFSVKE